MNPPCRTPVFGARAGAWLAAYLTAAALLGACAGSSQRSSARSNAGMRHPLAMLPQSNWPTNGGDGYNRRYSPLAEIDRGNVANLKGVWLAHLDGSGIGPQYSGQAQPLVEDGVIYISTGANDVFALDVDTGAILWRYSANLDPANNAVCCGWVSRGVALGASLVFNGQLDGKLVALDQATGQVVWSIQAERWQEGYTITAAPLYYDGLVITGFAGGERGIRGRVKAYDADDGALVWTFYTIPGPGEVGHETWPEDNDLWMDGGAPVWQTPAVDPELGLVYFSTGNPGPDYYGALRAGDNLFSSSIVALDVRTGEYRWHFQQVHHDIWDYDSAAPIVLFDLELDGVERRGLAQASKTGWVYVLDRTNGEPLIGIDERAVPQEPRQATAATQPYPVGDAFIPQSIPIQPEGFRLVNQGRIFTPFWTDEPIQIKPGVAGGANWMQPSYDVGSGLLYVCATDRSWGYISVPVADERPPEGAGFIGGGFGGVALHSLGTLSALDMHTNKLAWQQHWPTACYAGSLATAGGLLFIGRADGRLTALDSSDGTRLWEFQTGAGMHAPVTSFERNGKQYLLAYAAGTFYAGSVRGDNLWLFSLDGTLEEVEPGFTGTQALVVEVPEAGEADIDNGQIVYATACTFCHGEEGTGGHGGGPTLMELTSESVVAQIVTDGRNAMPPFGGALSSDDIRDVSAYVIERLTR